MRKLQYIVFLILFISIISVSGQVDSLSDNKQEIKKLQHGFSLNFINSNFSWFHWIPTSPDYFAYNASSKRPFKSDIITDIDLSYHLNYKSLEMTILNKLIPFTYPFGTKDIIFIMLGYGRRYHHNFIWGIQLGYAIKHIVSTSIIDNCSESPITGFPCYPQYSYNRPTSIIQLYFGYKIFKNKNLFMGIKMQHWMEYYYFGKTTAGEEWLVFGVFFEYLIYKKKIK